MLRGVVRVGSLVTRTLGRGVVDLLYPPVCAGCSKPLSVASKMPLCESCWRGMPVVGTDVCLRCGMPQGPHIGTVERCVACPTDLGGITETVALGRYVRPVDADQDDEDEQLPANEDGDVPEHPSEAESTDDAEPPTNAAELLRQMILKLKYRGGLESARVLGALLAGEVASRVWAADLDWVVPVPLHWRRQMERRYNQADLIAGVLAKRLQRDKVSLLIRTRHTDSQTTLPRLARARNVDGAFAPQPRWRRLLLGHGSLEGRNLLLIDDLLTTGATLRNCAKALKQAGAAKVYAAVAARA